MRTARAITHLFGFAALACVASAFAADAPAASPPQLEPKAVQLLKAMSARLTAAKSMTFTAVVSYEAPSVLGPPLVYSTTSDVTMQRPDKLRVVTSADGPVTEFYYDGKTVTAYAPAENLVASGPAPATIDATLEKIYTDAAIYYPFADVVVADPYKDFSEGMQVAFYIGQSHVVGGTTTDMVAFSNGAVFAQIWIGADDQLPRKLRAIYLNDPTKLRHDMDLSDWKLDAKIESGSFATPRAAKATRIAFARPDQMPPGMPAPTAAPAASKPKTP
jgi:hypothetical protein